MNLITIAVKNLRRNFSFYSLYFFSISFVLTIYFCFVSFSMNAVILEKISSDGRVETMCRTVSVFLMVFVTFYMFYFNGFFMRRRMKELGIYALLGYHKSAMLALLTFENLLICIGSTAAGIFIGGLLHKGITAGITALLGLFIDNSAIPLINLQAVSSISLFVACVLLTLTLSNAALLWRSTLLDLVRLEKKTEKPLHIHSSLAVLGILFLIGGYLLSTDILRGRQSLWYTVGFAPIALLTMLSVVIGTILFIYSFLPFVCDRIKRHKKILYRENTIVVTPKFMHRIHSNAKSLILLTLLVAGTLAVFGAVTLSMWCPYQSLQRIIPSAIEYRVTDEAQKHLTLQALASAVETDRYQIQETVVLQIPAVSDRLPIEYSIGEDRGRTPCFECISKTHYDTLLTQQGKKNSSPDLSDSECILIKYHPDSSQSDLGSTYGLLTEIDGVSATANVTVTQTSLDNPIGFSNSAGTLIVSDSLYHKMLESAPESFTVISINGPGMRSEENAYAALKAAMPDNLYLTSAWQRESEFIRASSSTYLLICFATVIFLIATGSILYFHNISSVTYDKADYMILQRMGYSQTLIRRCVRRQIQLYYIVPYIIGLLHSLFAIFCYKSALMDDLLGRNSAFTAPVLLAIALFTLIYLIYYQVTKHSCYRLALS